MLPRLLTSMMLSGLVMITESFPFGAGPSACKTLVPGHVNRSSQPEETCPYLIEPESEFFTPNKVFKVRLRTSMEKFKHRKIGGFFLQARAPGSDEPVGRWDVDVGEATKFGLKAMTCNHEADSITHVHSKPKTADLILKFLPIGEMPEEIFFTGTIARDYVMYWTGVRSPVIRKRHADPSEILPDILQPATPPPTTTPDPQPITFAPSAPSPRRIHHVTQTLHHNPHSSTQSHPVKHVRPSHHPHKKTTTSPPVLVEKAVGHIMGTVQLPTSTKTETDTEMERLLQEKKQLEEKDVAHKNLIVPGKALHADNEDIQNDGSTNPEAQQAKSKQTPARKANPDRSGAGRVSSLIPMQLLFFICYCALNLL